MRGRLEEKRCGSAGRRERRGLCGVSKRHSRRRRRVYKCKYTRNLRYIYIPLRINITPTQSVGSPGVRLRNTPCGHACLKPALVCRQRVDLRDYEAEHIQFNKEPLLQNSWELGQTLRRHCCVPACRVVLWMEVDRARKR